MQRWKGRGKIIGNQVELVICMQQQILANFGAKTQQQIELKMENSWRKKNNLLST